MVMTLKIAITFPIVLFAGFFSTLSAQSNDASNPKFFNIGAMLGVNASSFTERIDQFGDAQRDRYDPFVRFGPTLGLHSRFQVSKLLALRMEALFNGRGGSYRAESSVVSIGGNGDKNYINKNYRLNYFDIPVLAEIDFMANRSIQRLHVRMAAGASYGFNVASTLRYNGYAPTGSSTGPLVDVEEEFDVVDIQHASKTTLNGIVELSFDFLSGDDTPLFVKVRYTRSMNGVYDHEKTRFYNFETDINTWSVMFGFCFMKN